MDETITTNTIGKNFAEVEKDFLLEETANTRIIFRAQLHPGGIRGRVIRIKRITGDNWEEEKSQDFRKLSSGEGGNIELSTSAMNSFNEALDKLKSLLEQQGVEYGRNQYIAAKQDEVIITSANKALYIKELLGKGYSQEVWLKIVETDPDLATKLSWAQVQTDREKSLVEFEQNISDHNLSEPYWQNFFNENQWIFGYGLKYQILNLITDQPSYGGNTVTRSGEQRGDFLSSTEADAKFTVLIEIKKPQSVLVTNNEQRNGCYEIGRDLVDGINQIQVNCRMWEVEGSRTDGNREELGQILTCRPNGILLIGHTSQLDNNNKKISFQTFRSNLTNPEIITFDELLERARYIVNKTTDIINPDTITDTEESAEDVPF